MTIKSNKAMSLKLTRIALLLPHEETNKKRFQKLLKKIKKNKFITPIAVDVNSFTILDGHHRVEVMKKLGYKNIPAYLVNYKQKTIKVLPRRKNYEVNKKIIISRATKGNLYPPRTTKHIIKGLKNWKIPIEMIKRGS
jgi:hypothetical protein